MQVFAHEPELQQLVNLHTHQTESQEDVKSLHNGKKQYQHGVVTVIDLGQESMQSAVRGCAVSHPQPFFGC